MGHEGSALTDGETEGRKESRESREENVDHHRPFGFAFTRHNRQHFKGLVNHWLESTSLGLEFHATQRLEHFIGFYRPGRYFQPAGKAPCRRLSDEGAVEPLLRRREAYPRHCPHRHPKPHPPRRSPCRSCRPSPPPYAGWSCRHHPTVRTCSHSEP